MRDATQGSVSEIGTCERPFVKQFGIGLHEEPSPRTARPRGPCHTGQLPTLLFRAQRNIILGFIDRSVVDDIW